MITLTTDQTPWKVIPLKYCTVSFYEFWAWTQFPDGSGYGAYPDYRADAPHWPNFTDEYVQVARLTGHTDPLEYCLVHEFAHSWVAEKVLDQPSQILWALAHGQEAPHLTVYEEAATILFQAFLNGAPMFATSPFVDWIKIRDEAKKLLT